MMQGLWALLGYVADFAFVLIPSLFWLIRFWSRIPDSYSRAFARVLDFSVTALQPSQRARAARTGRHLRPDFGEFMTFERLFRYPTQHFRRHLAQLSSGTAAAR